ncbi:RNA polymerase sigma factor [Sphingomonas sp. UYP23]
MDAERQESGLQRLILNERARLLRFLAVRGAGDEAEDVLQDLWQRVAASTGQPIADPISYLFRAAENLMRDRRRSDLSRERRHHEWHTAGDAPTDLPGGERTLIARQRLRQAESVLAAQGTRVDRVFRRYRLEGEDQASIAEALGVSLSSVEKDLQKAYRALAALKVKLDAE